MNRRDALRGIGLSLGYVAVTPSILGMLQSCKTEATSWTPVFLSVEQGYVLRNLVDLILPKTEATPGALDVNVPEFIDLYVSKTSTDQGKKSYKGGIDAIMEELGVLNNRPNSLKTEDFDKLLSKYLRSKPEQQKAFTDKENTVFKALTGLRGRAVWAYKTSKEIGENVLVYEPIPGEQRGCIPLSETNGRAWSL
ncbi:gluconate 2-dehydrogenase subunit 3 family protein [Aureibaculum sp. 2210JD6-5]|uniref:gluconate 2-dehydrogenase subunit 3 family protein n=1 Tax=Aureibaculum sp. 2210JD6-5 TaxID=3103957 RepID=UPI002AAEB8D5|nr:gluconate 2-dehydrogenase subunit 3 family protein [Aureibaculum sp. 2210JD6-5]MDY7395757.1 gluconate 2-dehydrogenase subunit 3 family protein [Aureibaculum sp. 2210JD6-5]